MLEQELAMVMVDPKVTAGDLLPLLRRAIDGGDSWCIDYACTGLMMKCSCVTSEIEWEAVRGDIERAFPGEIAVLRMATLGWLFPRQASRHRSANRWACAQWLIDHKPLSKCHEHPYVYGVDDEYFAEGSRAWWRAITSHPNDATILRNASRYFFRRDPMQCEELLLRGAASDAGESWWQERILALRDFHTPR